MAAVDPQTGIWDMSIAVKRHKCDFLLAGAIATFYTDVGRCADLGCGNGRYCSLFKAAGWPIVHGFEGTPKISELGIYDEIYRLDLTQPPTFQSWYDFVLCLEVGEHIPPQHEQKFINNVCRFVSKDLILSWAIPGQAGSGHVNCKPNKYVIEQFKMRGMEYNSKMTKTLRGFSSLRWFKNTLLVFRRPDAVT
jgi:hypothetical protein